MEKYKIKYQAKRCVIDSADAVADAKNTVSLDLDSAYEECVGIAVHKLSDGGVANGDIQIALRTDEDSIQTESSVHNSGTQQNDGTSPNERFKDFYFAVTKGARFHIDFIARGGNAATDIIYEVILKLRKKVTVG